MTQQQLKSIQNNRIKLTENFFLDEFMHPDLYLKFGASSVRFLDRGLVNGVQWLRSIIDHPIVINDWVHGGKFQNSGVRLLMSTVGAPLSDHKYGRAADLKCKQMPPDEIRELIIKHQRFLIEAGMITAIEKDTSTWTHVANRWISPEPIPSILQIPFWKK